MTLEALGIPGFSYADLYEPRKLAELTTAFRLEVAALDPELAAAWEAYASGAELKPAEVSDVLVRMAPRLAAFLERMFGVSEDAGALREAARDHAVVFEFKKQFVRRRVHKRFAREDPEMGLAEASAAVDRILAAVLRERPADDEVAVARAVMELLGLDADIRKPGPDGDTASRSRVRALATRLEVAPVSSEDAELAAIDAILDPVEVYCHHLAQLHAGDHGYRRWASLRVAEPMDYQQLVQIERPFTELPELIAAPESRRRRRDGFELTDRRMPRKLALDEIDYCLYCHEREKDSCSTGIREKDSTVRKNPLGIPLAGCPLHERISEMHLLERDGETIAALATIMIDNPMCPGTGHRICNDCMKSCIFQKQDPVNIPQAETRVLTDVLELPWGVEIYGLLTRWNPLNIRRPHALPYNGINVLVVGMGPAGYTLAHYLANEGFGVVGIDGLKVEPLPDDWTGAAGSVPQPIRDVREIECELDERVLSGFGGVSEYGITVRWDKNFLTLVQLTLARRRSIRSYGGVRFGGTIELDDAWSMGFDHVAFASGAGRPTIVPMVNNLMRGIRKASDFLMALQLTGAFKRESMANLQVRLPAVVVGGGLTAIDTATECLAYYVVQCEKYAARFAELAAAAPGGAEQVLRGYDAEEREVADEFLLHARAIAAERERAAAAGESPDFASLCRAWGGVTIAYRKRLQDAPAYRLNHEEVIKALEEGIYFAEMLDPREAVAGAHGALESVVFERLTLSGDGKFTPTGERVTLPARSMMVAAGTHPNAVYEKEHPGTFERDRWGEYFETYRAEVTETDGVRVEADKSGFFTSYCKDGRTVSFYGDNHPIYAGNVVKAMASAKDGYPHVVRLFADRLERLDPTRQVERDDALRGLFARLDDELLASVVCVERLTPTIVEVVVRSPLAARKFQPGQFYRLQNFETRSLFSNGTRLMMEGIALTGAWVDREKGLLSLIVLEMGGSSRLCARLAPGDPVVVMGPTGTPTEIPTGETVLLAGGGLGNAVLFSIAKALKDHGNRVLYFAGYKHPGDVFKRDEIEAGTDQVVWTADVEPRIEPRRDGDLSFTGNIVECMVAYANGALGAPRFQFHEVDRIIAIGSDRMMAAVKAARHGVLQPYLKAGHVAIGSINSSMQCMMKEICAQCLQKHVDPETGKETVVFSCFNQDQILDEVDFGNLAARLKMNSVSEKLTNAWLTHVLAGLESRKD
ncbi:MAG: FAD-dependent oxidoreductase [Acidobacteria bacterium]|nr:FAD-dependent oxidoreductase [Acidobacteriota bacterium]